MGELAAADDGETMPSPFQFARSRLAGLRNSVCSLDWASILEMLRILRALKTHLHRQHVGNEQIDDLCDQLQTTLCILPRGASIVPTVMAHEAAGGPNPSALSTVDRICDLFDRLDI